VLGSEVYHHLAFTNVESTDTAGGVTEELPLVSPAASLAGDAASV
jgi:hypothetical protein